MERRRRNPEHKALVSSQQALGIIQGPGPLLRAFLASGPRHPCRVAVVFLMARLEGQARGSVCDPPRAGSWLLQAQVTGPKPPSLSDPPLKSVRQGGAEEQDHVESTRLRFTNVKKSHESKPGKAREADMFIDKSSMSPATSWDVISF